MINTIDVRTSADQILVLERVSHDRWGKGDPSSFLEVYAADITYFDPVTADRGSSYEPLPVPRRPQ